MDRADDLLTLLAEREEWEADQAAVAEFEAWYAQRILMEQQAESIAEQ
jgi:hypothetical protein